MRVKSQRLDLCSPATSRKVKFKAESGPPKIRIFDSVEILKSFNKSPNFSLNNKIELSTTLVKIYFKNTVSPRFRDFDLKD